MTASGWVGSAAGRGRLPHAVGRIPRPRSHQPRRFRQSRARLAGHLALRRRRRARHHRLRQRRHAARRRLEHLRLGRLPEPRGQLRRVPAHLQRRAQRAGYLPERLPAAHHHRHRRRRRGLGRARQARRLGCGRQPGLRLERRSLRRRGQPQHFVWRGLADQLRRRRHGVRPVRVQRRRGARLRGGGLPEPVNLAFGVEARRESYAIEAGEPDLLRSRTGRRRAGRRAGLPGLSSPATSSTKTARRTAPMSTSKRSSPRSSWPASRCAARTIPTSAPPSPARSPARYDFTDRSRCAARSPRASARRGCSRSSSPRPPPTSSTACPFEVGTFPATSDVAITLGAQPLDAEESRQLLARHGAALRRLRSHHRRVSHRHRRPHRALGEPQHAAGGGADRAVRRERGALLHQWRGNEDRRHRPGGAVPAGARKASGGSSSWPPATGTTPRWRRCPTTNVIRQHLQRAAAALHAARAVRSHQHPDLRRRHARQQDQPGSRLGTARAAASTAA